MISIETAFARLAENLSPLPIETVPLAQLVGRHLQQSVAADVDSPPHDKSVMDGVALRQSDFDQGVTEWTIVETIVAGSRPNHRLRPGEASKIMTGAPLPEHADAVVMIEQVESVGDNRIRLQVESVPPEQHVLRCGANFRRGQKLFPAGHRVRPTDIGLLAEVGVSSAAVASIPTVAILPTGDELVPCDQIPGAGQIRNSNGPMLTAMTAGLGLEVTELEIGRDDPVALGELIEQGLQHDLLILSGGVSAGEKDLVPGLLADRGVVPVFHRVLVKPGKPIWFGIRPATPEQPRPGVVFGLPGNPVSSLVGFQLFVRSAIRLLAGGPRAEPDVEWATLQTAHQTRGNRPTFWPGRRVSSDDVQRRVEAVDWKGSSDLGALGRADGLIHFPVDHHDHPAGETVRFLPF